MNQIYHIARSFQKFLAAAALCSMLTASFPMGVLTASAASLHGPVSATLNQANPTYASGAIDVTNYEHLTFSFDYNAEGLDVGDSFTYGWRHVGGTDNILGTVAGINEIGTTTPSDEIGSVSISLPVEAQGIADLELYVSATVDSAADTVSLTNIALNGDELPPPTPPTLDPFPSTNDLNITNNHPNVTLVSSAPGTVTLSFNNPTNSLAFFEVRIDGVTPGGLNPNSNPCTLSANPLDGACNGKRYLNDGDFSYHTSPTDYSKAVTNSSQQVTIPASSTVEVRVTQGAERDWDFDWVTFNVPAPVPTVSQCTSYNNVYTSDLGTWSLGETRATGHNELTAGGLHVWTEGAGTTDKAAGYFATNFALADAGVPSIEFGSFTGGRPSLQLGVDKDANGSWDGYLVYEPWAYADGYYWSSKDFGINPGMGYTSYGTLNEYLAANPNARVTSIGYSLGSGVLGDAVITKITAGCTEYTFGLPVTPPDASESKYLTDPKYVRAHNSGDVAAQALVPAAATAAHFTYTQTDGTNVYTDVAATEHTQTGQFPLPSTGQHQYRGTVSAEPGTYTVTGEFQVGATWYPITGSATLYVLDNPTGSFILPSATVNVFRPSDNPLRVSANDSNETFSRVVFTVSGSSTTYQVNRNQCDLRESGRRALCDISSASNWAGLAPGSYTGTATLYDKANNHAAITSLSFTVSDSVPVVTNFAITSSTADSIAVTADATDADTAIKNVHFYVTEPRGDGVCTGNGTHLADSVVTAGTGSTYTATLDTSALTGDYCVNVVAENLAATHSHPQSLAAAIDNTAPDMPVHVSPADNSFQNFNDFYFDWTDATDATEYEFQSSQNPAIDGNNALTTGVWNNKLNGSGDQLNLTNSAIHSVGANGTWYWQVRAIDAAGNTSAWTMPWKMTIDMAAPAVPTGLKWTDANGTDVANAGSTDSGSGTASWDANTDADFDHYIYKYWNDISSSPYSDESTAWPANVSSNQLAGVFNQGEGTHYFCVIAVDHAGNQSACSAAFQITYETGSSTPSNPGTPVTPQTIVVTAGDLHDWASATDAAGATSFETDGTLLGDGALQLVTAADNNSRAKLSHGFDIALASLSSLSYWTKQLAAADTTNGNVTLRIAINLDGTGTTVDDELMYEPYYNGFSGSTGWQQWEISSTTGKFWSNYVLSYNGLGGVGAGSYASNFTIADVLHDHPNAKIVGIAITMGTWNPSQTILADELRLVTDTEDTTYDFEPTAAVPDQTGGNTESTTSSVTSSGSFGFRAASLPAGQVLGASTTADGTSDYCADPYLLAPLGFGWDNSAAEVSKLQNFLNRFISANLPITGFFGTLTRQAVMDFQLKYASDILAPWGITNPTGMVYHTTKKKINELVCTGQTYPLTAAQLEDIRDVRTGVTQVSISNSPEGEVAGASTTATSSASSRAIPSWGDQGGDQTDMSADSTSESKPGFFKSLWNSIFGN